jgi:hypothetical protein
MPQPDNCSTSVRFEIDERAVVFDDHVPSFSVSVHTSPAVRAQYVNDNDLVNVPRDIAGFLGFYEARRARLEERLRNALGVA